jgi:hypothetical protein
MYIVHKSSIEDFISKYRGDKFHAILCDPPYGFSFMQKDWDSPETIAFHKETWEGLASLMYPGAFGMAFGGARTFWRLCAAMDAAGYKASGHDDPATVVKLERSRKSKENPDQLSLF